MRELPDELRDEAQRELEEGQAERDRLVKRNERLSLLLTRLNPPRHLHVVRNTTLATAAGGLVTGALERPVATSAILAAAVIALITPFLGGPPTTPTDSPPVAVAPPRFPLAPMPSKPSEQPSTPSPETPRSLPPDLGNAAAESAPQSVAVAEQADPATEQRTSEQNTGQPANGQPEPNERNENEQPAEPPESEPPEQNEPPKSAPPPDCTGVHVDLSPTAEACLLGDG